MDNDEFKILPVEPGRSIAGYIDQFLKNLPRNLFALVDPAALARTEEGIERLGGKSPAFGRGEKTGEIKPFMNHSLHGADGNTMATSHTLLFVMDPDFGICHKKDMDGACLSTGFT
jgi:hypothetical protein